MLINCTKLSETLLNHVAPPKLSYPVCIIRPAMKLRRKGQSSSLWGMRWRQGRRFKKDGTVQIRRRKSCSLAAKQWEINLRQQEREEGNNGRDESREEQIKKMMLCDKTARGGDMALQVNHFYFKPALPHTLKHLWTSLLMILYIQTTSFDFEIFYLGIHYYWNIWH